MPITSLTLINADTGASIRQLVDNAVIDISKDGPRLSIRANTTGTVGSVVFRLRGAQTITFTDSATPFALQGNTGTAYNPWIPINGAYSLTARPWTGTNATGTRGSRTYITFDVINAGVVIPPDPPVNVPPTVNAGNDQSITLPTNAVVLNATASDSDGTIVSRLWTKTAGPTSFTIASPTAAQTTVSGLVAGTYTFNHLVTDNGGATANDSVNVVVNPVVVPPNVAPVANAGANQTITLPTNFVNLAGTGTDSDGTITSRSWSQVSGPNTAALSSTTLANIVASGLIAGTYTFRFRVVDDDGAAGTDDMTVTVNAAPPTNIPPIADTGASKAITLPANTVSFNGANSTDPDGTIVAYRWTQTSGPAEGPPAVFSHPNSFATNVTISAAGTYVFRLTVTDNLGATGFDEATLTVFPATNLSPTANAGSDVTITLPTSSVTLIGSGSDPEGGVITFQWTKTSGGNAVISTPTAAQTTVTGLVQGSYIFQLRVTDNKGASAVDNVNVTVNPQVIPPSNTYYASPTGTGNGTSATTPFKISNFWPIAQAGYTLILLDGTYTGTASMIVPPIGKHGTATAPITIKAQNDGKVLIDGQRLNGPVDLQGNNYFVIEGINARLSVYNSSIFVIVRSHNNIFRRCIGWETSDGNVNIWNLREASFNLIEDCAGWGTARKIFGATQRADNNIFRRCFGRWEGSIAQGPKKVMTLSYNSYNNIAENCVGTWDALKMPETYQLMEYNNLPVQPIQTFTNFEVQQPGGIWGNDGFDLGPTVPSDVANIKYLGCVAFLKQSQRYHNNPNRGNAGLYYLGLKGTTVTNCVAFIEPGTNHQNIYPISCEPTGGTTSQSQLINDTRIGGTQASWTIDTASWGITNMLSGTNCSVIPAAGSIVNPTTTTGAVAEKRYVNGVLTTENLWPWPMNQRIIDAMVLGGYTGDKIIDVTASVYGLCGDVPPNPNATIVQKARQWLDSTGTARTSVEADLAAHTTDIDNIINQLKPVPTKTTKGKILNLGFTVPKLLAKYPDQKYHMYVPAHYTPSIPFGLMLWLHGGGSWDSTELQHIADYELDDETLTTRSIPRTETDTSNYILVTPQAPFGTLIPHPEHASRWDVPVTDQFLIDLITELSTQYNIDYNKVVIAGYSMGGIGAYHLAMRMNDRVAAVMAEAGAWAFGSWAALKNTPMYIIHGNQDAFWTPTACRNHNTAVEYAKICYELLSSTSNIHSLNLFDGGHTLGAAADAYWRTFINGQTGWVTTKTRNPYRTNTVAMNPWRSYETGSNFNVTWNEDPSPHTLWLSINTIGTGTIPYDQALKAGDGSCTSQSTFNNWSLTKTTKNLTGARAEATIVGSNQISVTTNNVKNLSIWLHPNMVNLSQPVQVSINGGAYVSYTPQPNLLKALQSYERRWDWKMIYHAEIVIPL